MSEGMILCAETEEGQIELLRASDDSEIGQRFGLKSEQLDQEFQKVLNPKKKIERKVLEVMKLNEEGNMVFDGEEMVTKDGFNIKSCSQQMKDCLIK